MGSLAEIHPRRGLPRGRGSLPPEEVAHAQRERMLRAMTSAAAELGYASVRIADVVDRARVSRQSFYVQFGDKEQCFLAAHEQGIALILDRLRERASADFDTDPRGQVRAAVGAYLDLAAEEPEFALCMLIELPTIGPAGLAARLDAHRQIGALLRSWHEQGQRSNLSWPPIPASRYAAAVGAVHDLVFEVVASGCPERAPALEVDAVDAVLTLLQIPRA